MTASLPRDRNVWAHSKKGNSNVREVPLLGIDEDATIESVELQEAAERFAPVGGAKAWEQGVAVGRRIIRGEHVSLDEFRQKFVTGYLNAWRCHFRGGSASGLLNAMERETGTARKLPGHLVELHGCSLSLVRVAFAHIDAVPGAGATTASKTLSAMSPSLFVMWDAAIADRYGFAANSAGYCRFLWLMAEECRRICQRAGVAPSADGARELELRLTPPGRHGPIPLAKLLDEWNWLNAQDRAHES